MSLTIKLIMYINEIERDRAKSRKLNYNKFGRFCTIVYTYNVNDTHIALFVWYKTITLR